MHSRRPSAPKHRASSCPAGYCSSVPPSLLGIFHVLDTTLLSFPFSSWNLWRWFSAQQVHCSHRIKCACSVPLCTSSCCWWGNVNTTGYKPPHVDTEAHDEVRLKLKEEGRAMGISIVEQLREWLRRARSVCHPAHHQQHKATLLWNSPSLRDCVQTHSRASLFHRKNKCHLYQMAMDFQHKQYFWNTISNSNHLLSARGTPLRKKKDSC